MTASVQRKAGEDLKFFPAHISCLTQVLPKTGVGSESVALVSGTQHATCSLSSLPGFVHLLQNFCAASVSTLCMHIALHELSS